MSAIEEALLELRQAEQTKDSAAALEQVRASFNKLSDDDRRKLLDMPAVTRLIDDAEHKAAQSMKPGSIITDDQGRVIGKVPWTAAAMKEEFGLVEWTPMQSRLIAINGIDFWAEKGVPCKTPPQFRDVAMEAWQAEERKLTTDKEIVRRNFGANGVVLYGDGTPA